MFMTLLYGETIIIFPCPTLFLHFPTSLIKSALCTLGKSQK